MMRWDSIRPLIAGAFISDLHHDFKKLKKTDVGIYSLYFISLSILIDIKVVKSLRMGHKHGPETKNV